MRQGWRWGALCGSMLPAQAFAGAISAGDAGWTYRGAAIALLGLLATLAWYGVRWRGAARQPEPVAVADPRQPPEGLSPADVRWLHQSTYDARCIAADLVDMAVRGYLRIGREAKLVGHRWRLVRQPEVGEDVLLASQQALAARLFARTEAVEVVDANVRRIANACEVHEDALRERRPAARAASTRMVVPIGIAVSLPFVVSALLLGRGDGLVATLPLLVSIVLVHVWAAKRLPASADPLASLRERVQALQAMFVDDAELPATAGDPNAVAAECARFQALLPYALALNAEQAWAAQFARRVGVERAVAFAARIVWYRGSGSEMLKHMDELTLALGDGLTRQIAQCSTPPGNR